MRLFLKIELIAGKFSFNNAQLLEVWSSNNREKNSIYNWIVGQLSSSDIQPHLKDIINKKAENIDLYMRKHLPKCQRNISNFKKKHSNWLLMRSVINEGPQNPASQLPSKMGRPHLNYEEAGPRLKRKLAADVAENTSTSLLVHAAVVSAKHSNGKDTSFVLRQCMNDNIPSAIKNKLILSDPVPVTPHEALAFLLENSFTKKQYNSIREILKQHLCDLFPSYENVQNAKLQCRPKEISVTETKAEVTLQNLLNHTASRILNMQEDVISRYKNIKGAKLIASYGFDGSTGQSSYKQRFLDEGPLSNDCSLFVTTIIPLKLVGNCGEILWTNRSPQSIRFCRPLKMEFAKETTDHILTEKLNLDTQIKNLSDFEYTFSNKKIAVRFELCMTLIDGKVLNILTSTKSCQLCPICGAGPKDFTSITNPSSLKYKPKPGSLQFGISPLHAWIRVFEFVLKLSYRMSFKKWQIRDESDKLEMSTKKAYIQKRLRAEMGLLIDQPKQNGYGNTTDGNTARKAFSKSNLLASVLDIEFDIIDRLHTILITISCEFSISCEKFKSFCDDTFSLYMAKYPWFPMSPTVHKILVHGFQIMESSVMPVGCLGENASEARNKCYKRDRRSHARQNTRVNNLTDVFNRSIDSSDPLVSSIFLNKRSQLNKKKVLPKDVVNLLETPSHINYNDKIENSCNADSDCESDLDLFSYEF